jgi:hypothetical protein
VGTLGLRKLHVVTNRAGGRGSDRKCGRRRLVAAVLVAEVVVYLVQKALVIVVF